jgi:hypothetical protein
MKMGLSHSVASFHRMQNSPYSILCSYRDGSVGSVQADAPPL